MAEERGALTPGPGSGDDLGGVTQVDLRGKYSVVRPLKVGGTAAIYLAVMRGENAFSREVVIKRPLPHLISDDRARLMFIDEAHIAARLQHPNICQVLDLVSRDDEVYLVLEYLRGVDLREVLKDAIRRQVFIPAEIAVWIGIEVAAGLHFSHEATGLDGRPLELVHRDVSPKNIRITFEGSVKLIDFGIARATNRATETAAGTIKGTLGYMSPEQLLGDVMDRRSDVFAFGICLFQMLTCRNPFDGKNLTERVRRLTQDPIPTLRSVNPALDEEIEEIVARCLARDVDDRYPTMEAVQNDLERYLGRLGVVSCRQRLIAHLRERFSGGSVVDAALADVLHTASQMSAPIDPSVRLRFPDDAPTSAQRGQTGPTFAPPASEQRTEGESFGETRPLPTSHLSSPAPTPARGGFRVPWVGLVVALLVMAAGIAYAVSLEPITVATIEPIPGEADAGQLDVAVTSGTGEGSESGVGPDAGATVVPPRASDAGAKRPRVASGRPDRTKPDRTKPMRTKPELGGRDRARWMFEAARMRSRAGNSDDARFLYELAYVASGERPPPSLFLNLGLLAQADGDDARERACLRGYLERRPSAPDGAQIRSRLAAMPATRSRRCVTEVEVASAKRRYARSGARVEGWIEAAKEAKLR